MSEVAEQPLVKNTTDNDSVRARMIEKANANRAAAAAERKPEAEVKPEVKADTVAQVAEIANTTTSKVNEVEAQAKAAEQMAQNNAKIEAEKKEAERVKAITTAQVAEQKLAEATKTKEWFEEGEETATVVNEVKANPDFESKAKAHDDLIADPFIEAYTTAKKAGKDITSFIKEVAPLDVDAIPTEKLYELSLQNAGLTPDEKEVEMEAFHSLTPLQKKRAVNEVKESLLKQEGAKLAKYITDNKVDQAKQEQFVAKYQSEKSEFLSKLKEKDYMGVKLNQADIEQALQYVEHGFPTTREDGSYNLPTMFELAVFRNKKKEISQTLINKGISLGREAVLKELARTDRNDGAGKVLPDVTTKNKSDEAKEIMRKKFGR